MDLKVIAVAFVALVGVWCVVVLPAMWLSGTMSQEEERREEPSTNASQHEYTNGGGE